MKKIITIILAIFATSLHAADSANDVVLQQRNSGNTAFVQRNVTPTSNSLVYFNSSLVPGPLTLGSGLSISLGTLNVAPAFSSITSTPTTAAGYGITNGATIDSWGAKTVPSGTIADLSSSQAFTNKTYNGLSHTANSVGFAIAGGTTSKTLTISNTLTFSGTDGTTMTFPSTSATIARTDAGNNFTGHQTIEGVTSTGATGTGNLVFATSPSFTTPTLGVATATSINKVAITAPASSATLTIADGKTFTASNTITLAGTDATTMTLPSSSTTLAGLGTAQTFTALNQFTGQIGINGAPSSDLVDTAVPAYFSRTTAPATGTVGVLQHNVFTLTPVDATTVQTALLADIQLNGADTLGAGHSIAMIARATDTASNVGAQFSGFEAKRVSYGASDNGSAAWFDTQYIMSSATGRWATGIMATAEFFNGTPSTPITTGGFVAFHAQTPGFGTTEGDSTKFWSLDGDASFALQTGGMISSYTGSTPAYGSLAANYTGIFQDSSNGHIKTTLGSLYLTAQNGFVIADTGVGIVPLGSGQSLGISTNRWALTATTIATSSPDTQTGSTYTVSATDYDIIINASGTCTLTLPTASTSVGRTLIVRTIAAQTVVSASSNVVPSAGGSAGTAILAATAGKWARLVSDGTNWQIMAAN